MDQNALKKAVAKRPWPKLFPTWMRNLLSGGHRLYRQLFIDALAAYKTHFDGTVASSDATAERLKKHGIPSTRQMNGGHL